MNSDQAFIRAAAELQSATGCGNDQARVVVSSIAAFISRFNEEMTNQHGPAWDAWLAIEKGPG